MTECSSKPIHFARVGGHLPLSVIIAEFVFSVPEHTLPSGRAEDSVRQKVPVPNPCIGAPDSEFDTMTSIDPHEISLESSLAVIM